VGAPDGDTSALSGGRLAYGCTDLTAAWPHGGTGLGTIGQVYLVPQKRWAPLDQEETNSPSEVLWLGGPVVVGLTIEGWDDAAIAVLHPNTAASGGRAIVEWPGSDVVPGAAVPTITNVVFTPWDTTNGKGFVLYKVAPVPDTNAELFFASGRYLEQACLLIGLPDASERVGKLGKFSDL